MIKVSTTVSVDDGPMLSVSTSLDVDAYDVIEKEIADGGNATLPVQLEAAGNVKLLFIKASAYPETSSELTYKATKSDGSDLTPTAATEYELDQPHMYNGDSVQAVADAPQYIKFTNGSAKAVTVTILVGRTAG